MPVKRYLRGINTDLYGDEIVRPVVWAVIELASSGANRCLMKTRIAEQAGFEPKRLHSKVALSKLETYGLVELIPKVHRENQEYVLINESVCEWLESTSNFGPDKAPYETKYPYVRDLIVRCSKYIDECKAKGYRTETTPSCTELYFEVAAAATGVEPPITASVTIESSRMQPPRSSTRWRLEIDGTIEGNLAAASTAELKRRIEHELTLRTNAALLKHRVVCSCFSVSSHLRRLFCSKGQCCNEDTFHLEVEPEKGPGEFHLCITNIQSDNNE